MNGICVRPPKIPERDRHCERAFARLSSVVCDTGRMALLRSVQAIEAARSLARYGYAYIAQCGKSAKFRPQNEALPIEPGSPNFARAFGPAVRREIRRRRDEISIHWGVRGGRKCGAPSPTRKPRVGSTSDRCQTEGLGHGSRPTKFHADRMNSFGDTGVRKITTS
jgi:hypothetical protein